MDIKYKITKLKNNSTEEVNDAVSVEEPLEMNLRYNLENKWHIENITITMRTPGNDEDLITGFLLNERIIENINQIEKIEKKGDKVGDYNINNTVEATISNTNNLDIGKIKRNFITNSSCGVCGKTSLDAIEVIKDEKLDLSFPKINKEVILKAPELLINQQSEFSRTGGIHASGLINHDGEIIAAREDVGRHNALDKLIGCALEKKQFDPKDQFITCSGRLNFELVQKVLMTDIGIMIGVGAPTSLAIDLANKFDITLIGFVKRDSFNIYTNNKKVKVE